MTSAFLSSPLDRRFDPQRTFVIRGIPRNCLGLTRIGEGNFQPDAAFPAQSDPMSRSAPMASADRKDIPDEGTDLSAVKDAAYSLGETLEEVVNERPLVALGVALGVGLLLGMTWRRR